MTIPIGARRRTCSFTLWGNPVRIYFDGDASWQLSAVRWYNLWAHIGARQ